MNQLVLMRVAPVLDDALRGGCLREFRQEAAHRFRLIFEVRGNPRSLLFSLRPELPWAGRPRGRWEGPPCSPGAFARRASAELGRVLLREVSKPTSDRWIRLSFGGAGSLVAELATHRANLILLDASGKVQAAARRPPSRRGQLEPGQVWAPPALPGRLLDPLGADPATIDAHLARHLASGEPPLEALRRHVFGVGSEAAGEILQEADSRGISAGRVLSERLERLVAGRDDPVIEAVDESFAGARLLPWKPAAPRPGCRFFERADAAATAGAYHEAIEALERRERRERGLAAIVEREWARGQAAVGRAREDLRRFEGPERLRRWGEALLAGLDRARRTEAGYVVPDPWDHGGEIEVPCRPGESAAHAAEHHFDAHRRARRGLERARARIRALESRAEELDRLRRDIGARPDEPPEFWEREMRRLGLAVGLEPVSRSGRARAAHVPPRLEGVRMLTSRDGVAILVGRNSRENHRLTFRLAAPRDFWFHAQGRRGAHVIVRNERNAPRPPRATMVEAAGIAAWYSEGRREDALDVQWTQRRFVRHPRGGPPGSVVLKRFETVRVRPRDPEA